MSARLYSSARLFVACPRTLSLDLRLELGQLCRWERRNCEGLRRGRPAASLLRLGCLLIGQSVEDEIERLMRGAAKVGRHEKLGLRQRCVVTGCDMKRRPKAAHKARRDTAGKRRVGDEERAIVEAEALRLESAFRRTLKDWQPWPGRAVKPNDLQEWVLLIDKLGSKEAIADVLSVTPMNITRWCRGEGIGGLYDRARVCALFDAADLPRPPNAQT